MANKKKKFTTPAGVAVYPRLGRPDTKYNEHGTYSADLRIPIEEAKPLLKELGDLYKAHTGNVHTKFPTRKDKEAIWYFDQDDDGDFDKDFVTLKLRAKNVMTKSGEIWDRKPKLFDAAGNRISNAPRVGGGTVMRVSFEADCYVGKKATGVRLIPQAVQIIDLVEFEEGGSAEDYGFGKEEGFTSRHSDDDEDGFEDNNNNNEDADNADAEEDEEGFY